MCVVPLPIRAARLDNAAVTQALSAIQLSLDRRQKSGVTEETREGLIYLSALAIAVALLSQLLPHDRRQDSSRSSASS